MNLGCKGMIFLIEEKCLFKKNTVDSNMLPSTVSDIFCGVLNPKMGKCLVGFCHSVCIFLFLKCSAFSFAGSH